MTRTALRWGWTPDTEHAGVAVRSSALAFDRVEIAEPSGHYIMSAEDFLEVPIDQRIRFNLERRLKFLRGSETVPGPEAMRSLMGAVRRVG